MRPSLARSQAPYALTTSEDLYRHCKLGYGESLIVKAVSANSSIKVNISSSLHSHTLCSQFIQPFSILFAHNLYNPSSKFIKQTSHTPPTRCPGWGPGQYPLVVAQWQSQWVINTRDPMCAERNCHSHNDLIHTMQFVCIVVSDAA